MKSIMRSHDVSVRKSPSVSATAFPVGYRMVGNDGNMWQIVRDSRGVQRWQKQAGGGYDTGNWQEYVPKKKKPAEKPEKKMPRMKGVTFIQDEDLQEKEDREMDEFYSKLVPVEAPVEDGIVTTKARKTLLSMKQILQDDPDMAEEIREVAKEKLEGFELFESSDQDVKMAADLYREFLRESFRYGGKVNEIDNRIKRYEAAMHRSPSQADKQIFSQKINKLKAEKRFV